MNDTVAEKVSAMLIDRCQRFDKNLKKAIKSPLLKTVYPFNEEGLECDLEAIITRACQLIVCVKCEDRDNCTSGWVCPMCLEEASNVAHEYGNRVYEALLDRYRDY